MINMFAKNWWVFALRGLFAIIFGVLAFVWPEATITALVLIFGAYAVVDGLLSAYTGFTDPNYRWWVGLLEGIVGVAAGLVAFFYPGLTAIALVYLVAVWAILTGAFEIWGAIKLREEIKGEWLLALSGVASIAFGLLLAFFPGMGVLTLVWLIAGYAIIFGVMTIMLAFRLRNAGDGGNVSDDNESWRVQPSSS